jgi:Ca2+-binding RTX toxin-like protein
MDKFYFQTGLGSDNVDKILEFSARDDKIVLKFGVFDNCVSPRRENGSIYWNQVTDGVLASGAFNTGTEASEADDRIIFNTSTGALLYDADGVGGAAAIQFATLIGLTGTLTAADFEVTPFTYY